jgi:SAM-dependent methyltransferase
MKKPSRDDPSKPKQDGYDYKKQFYQSDEVAADYDQHRFTTPRRQRRNRREWEAVRRALGRAEGVHTVLDMPCGTGRFTGHLAREGHGVVAADISVPMMRQARIKPELQNPNILGYVQADAEHIPLASGAVDCVVSIRFMFHVDPATRRVMLREMGRVSKRWLLVDYRHRYTPRWLVWRIASALRLTRKPFERVSRHGLQSEFSDAGLSIVEVVPARRWLSDKWMVLAERPADARGRVAEAAEGTEFAGLELGERIGEGRRSEVYRATLNGRDLAVKVYRPGAIASHERKLGQSIARFEFERNRELHGIPEVSRYIAEPIGFVIGNDIQFTIQELVTGPLYYHYVKGHGRPPGFRKHLEQLVRGCHAAGAYDLDLHAMNVMVERAADGELIPRLFDFNLIPFTVRARNPLIDLSMRLGILDRRSRDRRRLEGFDDFRRVERKHVGRYFHRHAHSDATP